MTLALRAGSGEVLATAWGPGADWALDGLPALLGDGDDWTGLDVGVVAKLADVRHRHPGLRLARTGLVLDALVPAVLEQKVTGVEARRAWRGLLYRYGDPAPGPVPVAMRVLPDAATLLTVPTWDWHRFGVDHQRMRTIRAVATVAARLEDCVAMPLDAALTRLRIVPGVGVWTAAETAQRALGHPDAVSVGDYHIPNQVVFALTGRPRGTDEEMFAVLEPWRGHRQRVVRLIEVAGIAAPRFGPRLPVGRRPGT